MFPAGRLEAVKRPTFELVLANVYEGRGRDHIGSEIVHHGETKQQQIAQSSCWSRRVGGERKYLCLVMRSIQIWQLLVSVSE